MALRLTQMEKHQETQGTKKYKKQMRIRKIRRSNKLEIPNIKYKGY